MAVEILRHIGYDGAPRTLIYNQGGIRRITDLSSVTIDRAEMQVVVVGQNGTPDPQESVIDLRQVTSFELRDRLHTPIASIRIIESLPLE